MEHMKFLSIFNTAHKHQITNLCSFSVCQANVACQGLIKQRNTIKAQAQKKLILYECVCVCASIVCLRAIDIDL